VLWFHLTLLWWGWWLRESVGENWSEGAMRRTCAWGDLEVKGTCLLDGDVERG